MTEDLFGHDWPFDVDDEPQASVESCFEPDFWAHYPRHEGKKDAIKAWRQLNPDFALRHRIAEHLKARRWPTSKRYIPLPASFIRGYRWTDEVDASGEAASRGPANRWHPTEARGGRIPDGHHWCEHDPMCSTDLDHIRRLIREKESA